MECKCLLLIIISTIKFNGKLHTMKIVEEHQAAQIELGSGRPHRWGLFSTKNNCPLSQ